MVKAEVAKVEARVAVEAVRHWAGRAEGLEAAVREVAVEEGLAEVEMGAWAVEAREAEVTVRHRPS